MKVSIYGTGYVGLVSGACLAELGHTVTCFDIDEDKIASLRLGRSPIYEDGLEDIIDKNLNEKRLRFSDDFEAAVSDSGLHLICVGTPSLEDGSADLSAVLAVAKRIAEHATEDLVIVTKSTVPVGTGQAIQQTIDDIVNAKQSHVSLTVASNPEFLREGVACYDFLNADRIIIGANDKQAESALLDLYAPLKNKGVPIVSMSIESAELTKYASNAMLATKISFINQMSLIADAVGANIDEISYGMGLDKRIGPHFNQAGCGYGGSCFPKDIRALKHIAENHQVSTSLIESVDTINHIQKQQLYHKIMQFFDGDVRDKTIALWGLAFKPGTDDLREASSLALIERLVEAGANVCAYDPAAMTKAAELLSEHRQVSFATSPLAALNHCDALAIVTEWKAFKDIPLTTLKEHLNTRPIFDGRNIYGLDTTAQNALNYFSIGRPAVFQGENE